MRQTEPMCDCRPLQQTVRQDDNQVRNREELVLAFHAYCQIPFAKTKASNPDVINLANLLGRTPSSVARKLGNFGAFDPTLAQKGISGLKHVSKADKAIWGGVLRKLGCACT